jgi:hypothetical protein
MTEFESITFFIRCLGNKLIDDLALVAELNDFLNS